jgi:uncharacterized protein YndB with AHSA1/START domain
MTNRSTPLVIDREGKTMSMSRVFDATPDQLWRIHTEHKLIPLWWGSRASTTTVDKMDVRVGGKWRFIAKDSDGGTYVFHGEYRAVEPHTRLVSTFEFEGMPGHVTTDHYLFEALPGGQTRLTNLSEYASLEDLEAMLQTGMEGGANEGWDRAEELLATLDM